MALDEVQIRTKNTPPAKAGKFEKAGKAVRPAARMEYDANGWIFQCPPGLANVLKKEMVFAGLIERKQTLFFNKQRNHDLVFVNRVKSELSKQDNAEQLAHRVSEHLMRTTSRPGRDSAEQLAHRASDENATRLRVAEAIYHCPVFGRYKVSKNQLQRMADVLKELGPRRLVVTVAGRHFQRHDFARYIEREMNLRGYEFDSEIEDEVWMFCIDESYYFGVPKTKSRHTEGREDRTAERRGSLPPPIAAAMAFAGMPRNTDVICDPTCGSGTLLSEAHAYAPESKLIGFDIDREAIAIAKKNLQKVQTVELINSDSRNTSLAENSVSLVLANLPFGVQFGERSNNAKLYQEILAEMLRTRTQDNSWRAILLTSDTDSLNKAIAHFKALKSEPLFKVKIRGELAQAVRLKI